MKPKSHYACQNCGFSSSKWMGRCQTCGTWNSFVEERIVPENDKDAWKEMAGIQSKSTPGGKKWALLEGTESSQTGEGAPRSRRIETGISELDRVLGGGLVPDSFVLLGGDPGIGKSTLLLQMVKTIVERNADLKLLYASGEESLEQIRSRAKRLGVVSGGRVGLLCETRLESVLEAVKEFKPSILIVDSLQTFSLESLESAPGSVSQVREISARLMQLAKTAGIAVWLVGHVTKEGSIAGPKVVEHMVDTVLYFESDPGLLYRLLRTVKNRFGSTRELGVFEMDADGLREVGNASALFLSDRKHSVPGTATTATLEGTRPFLVELQALVVSTNLPMPRRTAVGMDQNRIALISAILERHAGVGIHQQDLYFNVSGGFRLSEPAIDLAAAAAILSSRENKAFSHRWVFVGELGLTGEIRRVTQIDARIEEAKRLGFEAIVAPPSANPQQKKDAGIRWIEVGHVGELKRLL